MRIAQEDWNAVYQAKQSSYEAIQIAHDLAEDVYKEVGGQGTIDDWERYEIALNEIHAFANEMQHQRIITPAPCGFFITQNTV